MIVIAVIAVIAFFSVAYFLIAAAMWNVFCKLPLSKNLYH